MPKEKLPAYLISQFHPVKNGNLLSETLTSGSNKKVWWLGDCSHEWEARVAHRALSGSGCPYCKGLKVLAGFNDLATHSPKIAKELHPVKNIFKATEVTAFSNKNGIWLCDKDHEWEAKISNRVSKKSGCPYCTGKLIQPHVNDVFTLYPHLLEEVDTEENKEIDLYFLAPSSEKKLIWKGPECKHIWPASVLNRVKGSGCPYCSGRIPIVGVSDLATVNPLLASQWHPTKNKDLKPADVTAKSSRRVWWLCDYNHAWPTSVHVRASGSGCPYCSNRKVVIGVTDFATTHKELAATLKNPELGTTFTSGSSAKPTWVCAKGHEWDTFVYNRIKSDCPDCVAKTFISQPEKDLYEYITGLGFTVNQSDRSVHKNVSARELDLFVPERMFAVEFNGLYWHSELAGKGSEYHRSKFFAARAAGVELLQVWEDDWMNRRAAVLHTISSRLGAVQSAASGELTPIELTRTQVGEFLDAYAIQGAVSADVFYGLQDAAGVMQTVLALDVDTHSAEVVRFAARGNTGNGFAELLTHAVKILELHTVTTVVDNAVDNAGMFEAFGFIKAGDIAPVAYGVVKASRVTDSSAGNRIWNAGKTKYRFSV